MVPEGDPRPKKVKKRYASEGTALLFKSHNGMLSASKYMHGSDGLRIVRTYDAAERMIVTEFAVYIQRGKRTTKIHEWGHGPGVYIPF